MLQQGPELTQDAPASADSESAEPENPSEMPEPPDVDMTETDVSDGSSEMRKFQLHWLQLHKWLKFDSKLNKMFCQVCIDAKLSNAMTLGTQNFNTSTRTRHIKSADHARAIQAALALTHPIHTADCERAFSSQNLVTTALRNRLGTETCDQLMRVKLETPNKMKEFEFTDALLEWRKVKDRIIFQKTADQEN